MARILIVEDEALIAGLLEDWLVEMKHEICGVADNAQDALELAVRTAPDLVLLDIRIRGQVDGIGVGRQLRDIYSIPFVYLTAHSDAGTLARAGETDPLGYVTKPFHDRDLYAAVEMALYRHQAEVRQRKMERWLSTTLDSIGDAVIAADLGGRITYLNPMAETLTGWSAREALGRPYSEVFQLVDEASGECRLGKVEDCLNQGATIHFDDGHAVRTRRGELLPIDDSISPIRDGSVTGIVIIFRDRSRRLLLEQERLDMERRMHESQRLDTLGLLAAGIAHDFNNLLAVIGGNTALCSLGHPSQQAVYLNEIQLAVSRASQLCSQMLAYAGQGPMQRTPVDMLELVQDSLKLVSRMRQNVDFRLEQKGESLWVEGDSRQLQQVVLNLLINAGDALSDQGGVVDVEVEQHQGSVRVTVSDHGCGIAPDVLKNIFEPFFTTKQHGRGLGLAAAAGVMRAHQGQIEVESQVGEGSIFRVMLPAHVAAAPEPTPEPAQFEPLSPRTVLVVDDEAPVRDVITRVLIHGGYQVEQAGDGATALSLLEENSYDVVILDILMPELGGREVLARIRGRNPEQAVLLVSGYDRATASVEDLDFLPKPFNLNELLRQVGQLVAA